MKLKEIEEALLVCMATLLENRVYAGSESVVKREASKKGSVLGLEAWGERCGSAIDGMIGPGCLGGAGKGLKKSEALWKEGSSTLGR